MKRNFVFAAFLLIFVFSGCAHTVGDIAPEKEGQLLEESLPNGLKVFVLKDPNAPVAVFQIWYNAGSIHEQVGKTGLSHLLEHMMFKGTPEYGPKVFSKIISRAGGIDNAGTSRDYVFYHQKLAPDKIHLSIELEADRMRNLIVDTKETLAERDVVMEERRMRYDDDPQRLVYEEVQSAAFKNIPYRWPVIGWMEDLRKITRDDLYDYYRRHYVPNNAMIIVAGNIDVNSVVEKIRSEFGDIPAGAEIRNPDIEEPEQRGERRVFVKKEAELPYVLSAYKAPNILTSEDCYALEVLASVLSGGKSSRMYRSLIDEKRIALSAEASYSSLEKYPSLFYLDATALPGKSIDEVEKALYEEVEKIKKEAPDEREVRKAKNQIEAGFIMGQDSIFFQAEVIASFEMLGGWKLKDKYFAGIRNVTPHDVQSVARKYLVEDRRTVGTLMPLKVRSEE
ncbi:MAG: insulinase family protein [Nitrospiraceae bacterium]|nr:MAG: insulinase family protein [Nitrospiraceae bacterium]